MAYLLGHLGVFLMTHPSVHALFIPVEWLKVSALLHPLRFTEFLVFGGGLAALVNVAAQRRLVEKPWLCGTLHGEQGRRVWRGLAILLCTFVLVGAVMSPSSDERKSPGQRWYPLSLSLERALERGDVETADRILRFYPQALEWYSYCLLYTSPSPRDRSLSRMPSSA